MSRTGRPRQFNRDDAVDKAMSLFWEKGFESTSLSELKKILNLSSASFYAAFGSKGALYEECLQRYNESCGALTGSLDDNSLSPRDAMLAMLTKTIQLITSTTSPSGCMAVLSGLNCCDENKDVERLAYSIRTETLQAITRCVVRGVEVGELASTTDIHSFSLLIDSFVKGISIQARDGVAKELLDDAANTLLLLWK